MAENSLDRKDAYSFPSFEDTPESEKQTPKYSIDVSKAILDKYRRNLTAVGYKWGTFFSELRSFGAGKQDVAPYKRFLSSASATNTSADVIEDENRESARKGWYSVNWQDIVSFIPNIRAQIFGHFSEIDYDLKCDNIDLDSGTTEEFKMLDLYVGTHPVFGKMIDDLKQTANIPLEIPDFIPEDLQELEDMRKEGGFKEPYIQQHEKLLLHTENISDWDRFLKDELLADIVDLGYPFAYVDFDDETCMPKWQYADPDKVIMQYDHDNGFKNSDYAGVRTQWTVSKLKQYKDYIVHADGHKITEEEFKNIAKKYCKYDNNPDESEWARYDKQQGSGFAYDSFKVEVIKCWWKDVEYIKRIKYVNKYGKTRMYDYQEPIEGEAEVNSGENSIQYPHNFGENYSLVVNPYPGTKIAKSTKRNDGFNVMSNTKGKIKYKAYYNVGKDETLTKTRLRKLYYCWWIADTDFCIKYGAMPNQPRYDYIEPLLPLVGYRYPHKSLTFRCIPVENMYQIAWYRLQNGLAKASQGGYAINTSLLGDSGKKLDPLKVLKAWRENQVMFYKMGINGNVGGTPIPISLIPGNLAEIITNEATIMNMCMKWVEDQTGFSTLALGAAPQPEQGLGVTERSLQATQKSLMPIMTAMRYIKEELGKRTSSMWQLAIQNDAKVRKEAAKIIGEEGVFILQQAKSLDVQYGIKLVARPDSEIKQAIMQSATVSFQNKEITSDERLFIIEQLTSGQNPREIRLKLRKMIQKNRKMEEAFKQQAIQLQGQQNERLAQVQAQSAEAIKMAELKAKDAEARIQAMADIVVRDHDSYRKIMEMIAQKQLEMGQIPNNPEPSAQSQQSEQPLPQPVVAPQQTLTQTQ